MIPICWWCKRDLVCLIKKVKIDTGYRCFFDAHLLKHKNMYAPNFSMINYALDCSNGHKSNNTCLLSVGS